MNEPVVKSRAVDRKFPSAPAVRKELPLWIGLNSPSGGGKTKSALRLAAGIQKVTGGKVKVIDTESDRALHYADWFEETYGYRFDHLQFTPPFGSLHYLAAILQAIREGAGVVVVDSGSHEHDGIGGLLELHEDEIDRLQEEQRKRSRDGQQLSSRDELSGAAWKQPKQDRRRMINELMQTKVAILWCFRAKPKQDFNARGKDRDLGLMPVSGDDLIFEMTVSLLLPALAEGVPDWNPKKKGERTLIKKGPFKKLFERARQLDEELGESMARWSKGASVPTISTTAARGSATDRAAAIRGWAQPRTALGWTPDQLKAWLRDVFGTDSRDQMSIQQLEDAKTLLDVWSATGEEDYQAELESFVELGRVTATKKQESGK